MVFWVAVPIVFSEWPDNLATRLHDKTGLRVIPGGARHWSLFPAPGWVLEDVHLHDSGRQRILGAASVRIYLHWPSLLRFRLAPAVRITGLTWQGTARKQGRLVVEDGWIEASPLDDKHAHSLRAALDLVMAPAGHDSRRFPVTLSARLLPEPGQLDIQGLRLRWQKQWLTGNLTISNSKNGSNRFDLQAGTLDTATLSALLMGAWTLTTRAQPEGEGAPSSIQTPPHTPFHGKIQGRLRLERLQQGPWHLDQADMQLAYENKRLDITRLTARLFEGDLEGAGAVDLDAVPASPQLSAQFAIRNTDLGSWPKLPHGLQGRASGKARLLSHGRKPRQLLQGLNGVAEFEIADGSLTGPDVDGLICTLVTGGSSPSAADAIKPGTHTSFRRAQAHLKITGGRLHTHDLNIQLATARATASGSFDLTTRWIDADLGVRLTGDARCPVASGLTAITWPVRCRGKAGTRHLCHLDRKAGQRALRQSIMQLLVQ
ncbi:MAG: AsmA family protein [Kistimonas sp.]|nr:AsmA family protein [Kistimonas sp.]